MARWRSAAGGESALTGPLGITLSPFDYGANRASRMEGLGWLLLGAVAMGVVGLAVWTRNPVMALHMAVALALGSALFRGVGGELFRISFAMNVIWVYVLAAHFTAASGAPFTGGGDDLLFHETSRFVADSWANQQWGAHESFTNYSGYGYILLGAVLHYVSIPIGETGPLLVRLWGAFAAATIGPAMYVLSRALLRDAPPSRWKLVGAATGLFPIVIYYSAIGLRDIWLAAAAAWVIAWLASARIEDAGPVRGWIAPAAMILASAVVRPESAVSLLGFWLALLYSRRHTTAGRLAAAGIVGAAVVLGMLFLDTIVAQIVQQQLSYAYAASEAGAGSLGARILEIPGAAGWSARYVYAIVTPVPPLTAIRADTVLVGLGATAWYYAIPLAIFGWRGLRRKGPEERAAADAIMIFAGILLLAVALTSIDLRHKLPIIPPTIVLAACALATRGRKWRYDILMTTSLAGASLGAMYLILKLA